MEAVAQPRIEQGEFTAGFCPDLAEAAVPADGLVDALNLLPSGHTMTSSTGGYFISRQLATELATRGGYLQSSFGIIDDQSAENFDTTGYYAHQLFYFEAIYSSDRHKFLIAILSNGSDNTAANEAFFVLDLSSVNDGWFWKASFQAPHAGYEHWGGSASSKWYGGTGGIPMYCWDPLTDTFDDDCAAVTDKLWVDDVDDGIDGSGGTDTEQARDYAFKLGQSVHIGSVHYSPARSIRFTKWNDDDGTAYRVHDQVSRFATWDTDNAYWKSFECIQNHVPADEDADPGTGTDTHLFWKKVRLGPPLDDDNDVTADWFVLAEASQTIIGRFHGYRLWLRRHDTDNWSWAQYSAPFKPERNQVIADLVFDPTNWTPSTDVNGNGGGWENFRSGEGGEGDAIRAFYDLGTYFVVFKRWGSHVIAGTDESTWTIRDLDPQRGTVWSRSVCVHNGLIYFLALDGSLCVTDGTSVDVAPGSDKVRNFVKDRLDTMIATDDELNILPTLTSYGPFVWISLSDPDGTDDLTLVYHPETRSFWPTDLPILDACVAHLEGVETMFFSTTTFPTDSQKPVIFEYTPGFYNDGVKTNDASQDDNGAAPTVWSLLSGWFHFGLARGDRRIRRTWALLDSDTNVTLKGHRNYKAADAFSVTRTPNEDIQHFEGKSMHDAKAVQLELSGTAAVNIYGLAFDTEPRRTRYHTGGSY